MSITGAPGAGPNLAGSSISGINATYYVVIGILVALDHRDVAGGGGQYLDIGFLDAQAHAGSHLTINYFSSGDVPFWNGTAS